MCRKWLFIDARWFYWLCGQWLFNELQKLRRWFLEILNPSGSVHEFTIQVLLLLFLPARDSGHSGNMASHDTTPISHLCVWTGHSLTRVVTFVCETLPRVKISSSARVSHVTSLSPPHWSQPHTPKKQKHRCRTASGGKPLQCHKVNNICPTRS